MAARPRPFLVRMVNQMGPGKNFQHIGRGHKSQICGGGGVGAGVRGVCVWERTTGQAAARRPPAPRVAVLIPPCGGPHPQSPARDVEVEDWARLRAAWTLESGVGGRSVGRVRGVASGSRSPCMRPVPGALSP
jgi:hypothetical protein